MITKPTIQIEVRQDMRDFSFFQLHNFIVDDYIPLIGVIGLGIYNVLVRRAMRDKMNTKLAQTILCEHLSLRKETARIYILTLELCGLIYVNRKHREVNEIFILQPKQLYDPKTNMLNQATLDEIQQHVIELSGYDSLKKTLLGRLADFKSLFQRLEDDKQTDVIVLTNNKSQSPAPVDTPAPQSELVSQLVELFAENNLSETAAERMITDYGEEAVKQQLEWLPARQSDTPLRTLRASLKENWREPKAVGRSAAAETFTAAEMAVMTARMNEANESAPAPDPLWQEVKERLHMQLTQATFDSWVKSTELVRVEGNQWLIQCGSTFAQDWLENRLNGTLTRTASSVAGQAVELKFIVTD